MRHSAVTFADQLASLLEGGRCWDIIFCSDMLNLAEFLGLAPPPVRQLPAVVYFHENQLTYPVRFESERDYQFAVTNMTTALAASAVWFNSEFHKESFLEGLVAFLKKMPDYNSLEVVKRIRAKSSVHPPGISDLPRPERAGAGPLHILWVARWEHDKNPEDLFDALKILKSSGAVFRLSVIGQSFRDKPVVFDQARQYFAEHVCHWGYQQTRVEYERVLGQADVVVSTARHEFFGIGIVEAITAGAYPLLPNRLSYPEILGLGRVGGVERYFYDGTVEQLAERLFDLAELARKGKFRRNSRPAVSALVERFKWTNLAPLLDDALEQVAAGHPAGDAD